MIKSNYIVHDCETGGLDCNENPITEYAAIILEPKTLKEVDRWETFIKPYNGLKLTQESLDRTMVNISDINAGIDIKQFNKTYSAFLKTHQVKAKYKDKGRLLSVGHNIPFDHGFLEYALNLGGLEFFEYVHENFIDTLPLAKLLWGVNGDEKINLGICCERAKIKLTDAHGAMNDTESTADLFRFFAKKIRSKKGDNVLEESSKRAIGAEFYEFRCGQKSSL